LIPEGSRLKTAAGTGGRLKGTPSENAGSAKTVQMCKHFRVHENFVIIIIAVIIMIVGT